MLIDEGGANCAKKGPIWSLLGGHSGPVQWFIELQILLGLIISYEYK